MKELLEAQGFRPEPDPQGNLALGYGCVSVQRRDNWAAVVRGHSRYLWAAEHYLPANFYGRYLALGRRMVLIGTVFRVRRVFICLLNSCAPTY